MPFCLQKTRLRRRSPCSSPSYVPLVASVSFVAERPSSSLCTMYLKHPRSTNATHCAGSPTSSSVSPRSNVLSSPCSSQYFRRISKSSPSLLVLKCLFVVIFASFLIRGYKGSHFSAQIVSFCYTIALF